MSWRGDDRTKGVCVGFTGEGCHRGVHANERCASHYRAWLRAGKPPLLPSLEVAENEAMRALLRWAELPDRVEQRRENAVAKAMREALCTLAARMDLTRYRPRLATPEDVVIAGSKFDRKTRRQIAGKLMRLDPAEKRERIRAGALKRVAKHGKDYLIALSKKGSAARWGRKEYRDQTNEGSVAPGDGNGSGEEGVVSAKASGLRSC